MDGVQTQSILTAAAVAAEGEKRKGQKNLLMDLLILTNVEKSFRQFSFV